MAYTLPHRTPPFYTYGLSLIADVYSPNNKSYSVHMDKYELIKAALENGDILQNNLDSLVSPGRNDASGPALCITVENYPSLRLCKSCRNASTLYIV